MLDKILFPIDGSDTSKKAVKHVIEMAKKFSAKVIILHAYELPGEISVIGGRYGTTYSFLDDMENNLLTHGKFVVGEMVQMLRDQDVDTEILLVKGSAGPAIIDAIRTEQIEMVIMCSRGLGAMERVLLGSVSDYVVHHTKCPVLLIH